MARLQVEVAGATVSVEPEDVLAWREVQPRDPEEARRIARESAAAYVVDNPRPDPDAQGAVNVPARQRMALLRRLAAGPATKRELLEAMRDAAGYVGGDDWRNRMDELRGHGKRGGGHTPLPIEHDVHSSLTETYRLTEAFPALSPDAAEALGVAKGALAALGGVGVRARAALEGMLPDVAESPIDSDRVDYPSEAVLGAFDAAMRSSRPVRMHYRRAQHGPKWYDAVVPRYYLTGDTAIGAYVVELDPATGRRRRGIQIPLDRLLAVEPAPDVEVADGALVDPEERLTLQVTDALLAVLTQRRLFGIDATAAREVDVDGEQLWEVEGTFNPDQGWETLRPLLAFTGSVRIAEPAWLGHALAVRCLEGLLTQLTHPARDDQPSYPRPDLADAAERLEGLGDDLIGVFETARSQLVPPAPPREPGKAAKVVPTGWSDA